MAHDQHVEQTVVNKGAGSDLKTAACLAPVADDRDGAAASDFPARQYERSVIMMKVHCQNCTHHGVGGRAKQALEFGRGGRCNFGAKTSASYIQEPVLIGLANID